MTDSLTLVFLGAGAAAPTLSRSLPSLAIQTENRIVLCDCGEGTQMQIQRAGLSPSKIQHILISHLHGDHILGLPGFINTQQLMKRITPLTIYGPPGLKRFMECVAETSRHKPDFPFNIIELDPQKVESFSVANFSVTARNLRHSDSTSCLDQGRRVNVTARNLRHSDPCLGYRLQEPPKPGVFDAVKAEQLGVPNGPERAALQRGESILVNGREIQADEIVGRERPGRIIAYCTDTRPCDAGISLAEGCDLLVHDATFSDACADRAKATMHSTSREAALVARRAGSKKLALWHISLRVQGDEENNLLSQAREEFAESVLPQDLESMPVLRREADNEP